MKHLCLVLCIAASAAGFAQTKTYQPVKTQSGIQALTDTSYQWVPQVQPAFRFGAPSPRNPDNPSPPLFTENTLPTGVNQPNMPRISAGARYPGITNTGWVPADPNIAVGPAHIVEVVNSDIAWFDKASGFKQFQVGMEPQPGPAQGFFESLGTTQFIFDPKAFYDQVSQRFFVVALEQDDPTQTSKVLIAVSDDSNPNGTWHKYRLEAKLTIGGNVTWLDYPGFGWNKDSIVVTGNMFGFSSGFGGVQALVIPKTPLLSGSAASAVSFLLTGTFTVQVAHTYDASSNRIYMVSNGPSSTSLRVYAVTGIPSSPSISSADVTVPSYRTPAVLAPSTGGHFIDPLDGRMLDADWRGGKLVCAHTNAVSASDTRNMVRWYEINTNNFPSAAPTFSQAGNVIGGAGQHYYMPGIGVNSAGDIALFFSRSSTSIVADVMAAGRKSTDPPGTMGTPILVKQSAGATYGFPGFNRWGDYHAMEVDPVDDLTFWGVSMLGQSNGTWTTEISSLKISTINPSLEVHDPNAVTIYTDAVSVPPQQGQLLTGTLAQILASDNTYVTVNSVLAPALGQIAALEFTFSASTKAPVAQLSLKTEMSSTYNVTAMIFLWDWTQSKYVQYKSVPIGSVDVTTDSTPPAPLTKYVSSTGVVKAVVRAIAPGRFGRVVPAPFTLKIDDIEVRAGY